MTPTGMPLISSRLVCNRSVRIDWVYQSRMQIQSWQQEVCTLASLMAQVLQNILMSGAADSMVHVERPEFASALELW